MDKLENAENTNKNRYDTILINEAYQKIMHNSSNANNDSAKKDNFKSITFKPNYKLKILRS